MTWRVIGRGAMADAVRAELARDPDAYRPETWSIDPVGRCSCCDQDVFRCTTRHTGWIEGFATHANVVHPRCNAETSLPDPNGDVAGCCCKSPQWGPQHSGTGPSANPRRQPRRSRRR